MVPTPMATPEQNTTQNVLRRWWRVSLRAKGVLVLAAPMFALFAILIAIRTFEAEARQDEQIIDRAYAVQAQATQLHSSLFDAEQALENHIATGQDRFLAASRAARARVEQSLQSLDAATREDTAAAAAFAEIRRLIAADLALLDEMRNNPSRVAREKAAMADVQARIAALQDLEQKAFTAARDRHDQARRSLLGVVIICGLFGPLGALFSHLVTTGRLVSRLQAVEENARRLAHGLPLDPFPPGTDEIASLANQLENAAYLLRERERETRESERRYRDLFDQAPVPYEEADREGVIRRFNQAMCTLLKISPQQMMARHAWDFLPPERRDEFRAAVMERMSRGIEAGPWELEYVLDDGSRLSVEIRENLIRNDRGEVNGIIRSVIDITERNLAAVAARKVEQYALEVRSKNEQLARALEAARAATTAKSRFLASVSHELRTPLNGIIGFSELLYDGRIGELAEEQREVIGDILTSSRHLLQLINDILDLSKVEAGRMEFRPERHRIETLVLEVRDVVRPMAEKKGIEIALEIPPDLCGTLDPARFKQVLYNYLSNAVKFTPDQGRVTVRILLEGADGFRLEVEDTGIGIPEEEIPRLFQEFAQLPNSRRAEQGTGLGLALTRHIVEAQGGSVSVRSTPGKGSVFSAVLPMESIVRGANS
jgi:PAS domain S-box-containing protein